MAPLARVVHALPGRKRIKIPEKRGDDAYFIMVKEGLAGSSGILAVETNSATASVLIRHSANTADFLHSAAEQGLFSLASEIVASSTAEKPLVPTNPKAVDRGRRAASRLRLNLRRLMFLSLVATGIAQTIKGNITAPALTAFSHAMNILPRINDDHSAGGDFSDSDPPRSREAQG